MWAPFYIAVIKPNGSQKYNNFGLESSQDFGQNGVCLSVSARLL